MAARPHLLGLPAELRLRIWSFVLHDLSYFHGPNPNVWRDTIHARSKASFQELKSSIGIIWTNRLTRREALPFLARNLTVSSAVLNDTTLRPAPRVIREHAQKALDLRDPVRCWRTQFRYLTPLIRMLPCLRDIIWRPPMDSEFIVNMNALTLFLRGKSDKQWLAKYLSSERCGGRLKNLNAVQQQHYSIEIEILLDVDLVDVTDRQSRRNWDDSWPNNLESLYRLQVDAFTRAVLGRSINLAEYEDDDPDWYPAQEVLLLTKGVSWPILYHEPTATYKPLINVWPWSEEADKDYNEEAHEDEEARKALNDFPEFDKVEEYEARKQREEEAEEEMKWLGGGGESHAEDADEDERAKTEYHIPRKVQELADRVEEELNDEDILQKALESAVRLG